jgi:hypothetical protein
MNEMNHGWLAGWWLVVVDIKRDLLIEASYKSIMRWILHSPPLSV